MMLTAVIPAMHDMALDARDRSVGKNSRYCLGISLWSSAERS
jgi:hypothetical protein